MEIILRGPDNEAATLEKFVITLFVDRLDVGKGFLFVEVCSRNSDTFQLVIPRADCPRSQPALYLDKNSCSRLFSGYEVIDESTGEHIQRVGETRLHVQPVSCVINEVAPAPEYKGLGAYHVTFGGEGSGDVCRGSWLVWEQDAETTRHRNTELEFDFKLRLEAVEIRNFYIFVVLPTSYRSQRTLCEVCKHGASIDVAPITNPMYEFELNRDFLVFPLWRSWIYARKILRNRDPLVLTSGEKICIFVRAVSDVVAARMTTVSYFTGIGFALSASVLANSIFYLQQHGLHLWPVVEAVGSAVITAALGFVGWNVLRAYPNNT